MKFDTSAKVWEAASKDLARPVMTHVNLAIRERAGKREAWLEATDSYILVRVPCEVAASDVAGLIPVEALKAAKGGELDCNGSVSIPGGVTWPRPEGTFPDAERLIPDAHEAPQAEPFGIDAARLAKLQKALGSRGVKVTVGVSPLKTIRVDPLNASGAVGVIMPIRLAV